MGRRWSRKNKKKNGGTRENGSGRKPADPSKYGQERDPYALIEGGNFKMEVFYAIQGLHDYYLDSSTNTFQPCTTDEAKEEERQRWLTTLKSILPASFRIGNDVDFGLRERLENDLEEYVGKEMEIVVHPKGGERRRIEKDLKTEIKTIAPAKKIPFIPHAYQLSFDRQTIRRNITLTKFHEWLKAQTEAGFVTRQETVSMIPPVVLDVEPHHFVLDMCAAPGSKTSQLLEAVNIPLHPKDPEPTGCVVANDSDERRAYMLVHQLRRINSPAVFITSCDAQFFPTTLRQSHDEKTTSDPSSTEGMFDRVLCDVPCGGDGTTRKNPGIWKKWNQLNSYGLHALQLAIALKGARLTKVGGYLCYSTCSMNPIENEAVVAEVLRVSEGSLELVDRRADLPGLLARPGWSKWRVLSEGKSKRQIKDLEKKNNDKMKARRKAWDEKQKQNGSNETTAEGELVVETVVDGQDKEETSLTNQENSAGETKEIVQDDTGPPSADSSNMNEAPGKNERISSVQEPFQPSTFNESELKALAERAGLKEYKSFDEVPVGLSGRIRQSCFPPTDEEAATFHMERCFRVLPQDMDTGGFFVALMKKVAPINSRARGRFQSLAKELQESVTATAESGDDEEPSLKRAKIDPENTKNSVEEAKESASNIPCAGKDETASDGAGEKDVLVDGEKDSSAVVRGHVKKNYLCDKDGNKSENIGKDDFIPIPQNIFDPLIDFYGLSFESFEKDQYMVRACGDAKVLYFMGKSVKKLIDSGIQERVTVVNSGLKGFIRNNKECEVRYRVAQEGVHFIAPHMTKRKVGADMADFRRCLTADTIQLKDVSEGLAVQIRPLKMGAFVVYLKGYENDYIKKLTIVMWRCRSDAINCLVSKPEIDGMKSKIRSILNEKDGEGD